MASATSPLRLTVHTTAEEVEVVPDRLVIAGYTGRDERAVAAHIAELAEIGVPPPPSVPAFYDIDPGLLSTGSTINVRPTGTSGEVEPVIVRHAGRHYLAVGSDHTDRELEKTDICASKVACLKPIGSTIVRLPEDLAGFDWDGVVASSEVDTEPYQHGALSALRTPADVLERMSETLRDVEGDLVVFCGTLPLLTSRFVYGQAWTLRLELGDGTTIAHTYDTNFSDTARELTDEDR